MAVSAAAAAAARSPGAEEMLVVSPRSSPPTRGSGVGGDMLEDPNDKFVQDHPLSVESAREFVTVINLRPELKHLTFVDFPDRKDEPHKHRYVWGPEVRELKAPDRLQTLTVWDHRDGAAWYPMFAAFVAIPSRLTHLYLLDLRGSRLPDDTKQFFADCGVLRGLRAMRLSAWNGHRAPLEIVDSRLALHDLALELRDDVGLSPELWLRLASSPHLRLVHFSVVFHDTPVDSGFTATLSDGKHNWASLQRLDVTFCRFASNPVRSERERLALRDVRAVLAGLKDGDRIRQLRELILRDASVLQPDDVVDLRHLRRLQMSSASTTGPNEHRFLFSQDQQSILNFLAYIPALTQLHLVSDSSAGAAVLQSWRRVAIANSPLHSHPHITETEDPGFVAIAKAKYAPGPMAGVPVIRRAAAAAGSMPAPTAIAFLNTEQFKNQFFRTSMAISACKQLWAILSDLPLTPDLPANDAILQAIGLKNEAEMADKKLPSMLHVCGIALLQKMRQRLGTPIFVPRSKPSFNLYTELQEAGRYLQWPTAHLQTVIDSKSFRMSADLTRELKIVLDEKQRTVAVARILRPGSVVVHTGKWVKFHQNADQPRSIIKVFQFNLPTPTHEHLRTWSAVRQFIQEFSALRELSHLRHVQGIDDEVVHMDRTAGYLKLERLDLSQFLTLEAWARVPLTPLAQEHLGLACARGLAEIHRSGWTHGRLSARTIWIQNDSGEPKFTDFAFALRHAEEESIWKSFPMETHSIARNGRMFDVCSLVAELVASEMPIAAHAALSYFQQDTKRMTESDVRLVVPFFGRPHDREEPADRLRRWTARMDLAGLRTTRLAQLSGFVQTLDRQQAVHLQPLLLCLPPLSPPTVSVAAFVSESKAAFVEEKLRTSAVSSPREIYDLYEAMERAGAVVNGRAQDREPATPLFMASIPKRPWFVDMKAEPLGPPASMQDIVSLARTPIDHTGVQTLGAYLNSGRMVPDPRLRGADLERAQGFVNKELDADPAIFVVRRGMGMRGDPFYLRDFKAGDDNDVLRGTEIRLLQHLRSHRLPFVPDFLGSNPRSRTMVTSAAGGAPFPIFFVAAAPFASKWFQRAVALQIDSSLRALHSVGWVHGDLTPNKCRWSFVTGQMVILEFSSAATLEESRLAVQRSSATFTGGSQDYLQLARFFFFEAKMPDTAAQLMECAFPTADDLLPRMRAETLVLSPDRGSELRKQIAAWKMRVREIRSEKLRGGLSMVLSA